MLDKIIALSGVPAQISLLTNDRAGGPTDFYILI